MKKAWNIYKISSIIKIISITVAAGLNIYGLALMFLGNIYWTTPILYAMYSLGSVLVFSIAANFAKDSLVKRTKKQFLKDNNLEDSKIHIETDNRLLIEKDSVYYTVEFTLTKSGVGYIYSPANVEWEGQLFTWDGKKESRTLSFMPAWDKPNWSTSKVMKEDKED